MVEFKALSEIRYSEEQWAEFEAAVDANLDEGLWRFEKNLRAFVERAGWDWMPLRDKSEFYHWALTIYKNAGRRRYNLMRRQQLRDAKFDLWIMQGYDPMYCPAEHSELKGLVLPSDHPFWREYMPPNDWTCKCYIIGARTMAGACRRGGDPNISLPDWWAERRGINPHFRANHLPDLREVIGLLHSGYFE